MKYGLSVFIIVLSINYCQADYSPITLPKLIETSDLILHIEITKDIDERIEARILEVIKGDYKLRNIMVEKFEDWTCASRWSEYQIGQRELIFLQKHRKDNTWIIMGAGNEGEMPIENDKLYYKSPFFVNGYFHPEKNYELKEGNIHAIRYELSTALEGLKMYLEEQMAIEKMTDNHKIIDYYPQNAFIKRAIDEKVLSNRYQFSSAEFERRQFERENQSKKLH